jgi:hypothetical protein
MSTVGKWDWTSNQAYVLTMAHRREKTEITAHTQAPSHLSLSVFLLAYCAKIPNELLHHDLDNECLENTKALK